MVCPRCCAQIRGEDCDGCHYYAQAARYQATRATQQVRPTSIMARIDPQVDEVLDQALEMVDRGNLSGGEETVTALMRQRIGNSTVPGRSYHLDHCHQVPESDSTCPRDRSREGRKRDFEETQARYCARNRRAGRSWYMIDLSPCVWRATRSGHWRWVASFLW